MTDRGQAKVISAHVPLAVVVVTCTISVNLLLYSIPGGSPGAGHAPLRHPFPQAAYHILGAGRGQTTGAAAGGGGAGAGNIAIRRRAGIAGVNGARGRRLPDMVGQQLLARVETGHIRLEPGHIARGGYAHHAARVNRIGRANGTVLAVVVAGVGVRRGAVLRAAGGGGPDRRLVFIHTPGPHSHHNVVGVRGVDAAALYPLAGPDVAGHIQFGARGGSPDADVAGEVVGAARGIDRVVGACGILIFNVDAVIVPHVSGALSGILNVQSICIAKSSPAAPYLAAKRITIVQVAGAAICYFAEISIRILQRSCIRVLYFAKGAITVSKNARGNRGVLRQELYTC